MRVVSLGCVVFKDGRRMEQELLDYVLRAVLQAHATSQSYADTRQ